MAMLVSEAPPTLTSSWKEVLQEEFSKPYMEELALFLRAERNSGVPIYPPKDLVFNALNQSGFEKTKVVIIGQDPYHGEGQAHGLSFSVPHGVRPPPSLKNVFKELNQDLGVPIAESGDLTRWAKQGVLLLNATLTVRKASPKSHYGRGWELFTDTIVKKLLLRKHPVVFLLWGKSAKEKIDNVISSVPQTASKYLTASHPSPYSAHSGFFGCCHFSKANEILKSFGSSPISW